MKFGQKIFLITFIFVTICINIIGTIIINNNHKTRIDSKINNNISNLSNIVKSLKFYDITNLNIDLLRKDNTYYSIYQNNDIIFTNLIFETEEIKDKIKPTDENIKAIIIDEILYMSVKDEECSIIIAEDIKDVFDERKEQVNFFIQVSFISSFFIALCLYIIIYLLTRKINKLNKTVNKIAKGDFSARSQKLGNDEIGILALQFNKMADSVESTIKEINRVSENRQNFIHNITHEIRTPLTSIIGFSSLIKEGRITEKEDIIEYSNRIYQEGNYLNLISQRLMEIVLLENKSLELKYINISEIIQETVNHMNFSFKEVLFKCHIAPNIYINSDKTLLQSLLINLIKNAIMAYEKNKQIIVFVILEKSDDNNILLRIIDKGKGIPDDDIKKVIEPFYTINKDRNRKISGMGLGLPLCIKICEYINASLSIESKLGEGTCINIKFVI